MIRLLVRSTKAVLTMLAKTNKKSAVWFPCLAATFSSATSATCKYLCAPDFVWLPSLASSYFSSVANTFEAAPEMYKARNKIR